MPKINVENIDDSKKIQILKKAVGKRGSILYCEEIRNR